MDSPYNVGTARNGDVWAVGNSGGVATVSRYNNKTGWSSRSFPALSWGVEAKAVFQTADGSLWFGASGARKPELGHLGGVVRLDPGPGKNNSDIIHFTSPEVPDLIYGMAQTSDGVLWQGGFSSLHRYENNEWSRVEEPKALRSRIDIVYGDREGGLWIGHRTLGVFH
jgi:ligand-binding sensor domain-containing protein